MNEDISEYLTMISQFELLTPEDEIDLANKVKSARAKNASDEVKAIAKRARDRMVESNLRLVISIAKKYVNRGMELIDLIQEGTSGLMRSLKTYDPDMGNKFSTYATFWIRQAITRSLSQQANTIRLPAWMVDAISKFKKMRSEMLAATGEQPTDEEVFEALELTEKRKRLLKDALNTNTITKSSAGWSEDEDKFIETLAADPEPEDNEFDLSMVGDLVGVVLSERERAVVNRRYGLGGEVHDGETLNDIGEDLEVTRERVRQIQKGAVSKLRLAAGA